MNGYRFEITSNTALAFGNPVIGISPTDDPARLTIHHGASGRKNEGWITIVLSISPARGVPDFVDRHVFNNLASA
jgi:hypothetical protein